MKNQFRKLFRWIPVSMKAKIEFYFDKSLGKEFGGPFNGQKFRQNIFKDLIKVNEFKAIVETGTFRGVTTNFMADESGLPVYTVEADKRFFHYAKLNLRRNKKIFITLGDSRKFIESLANDTSVVKNNVLFYLDAHWYDDLPLYNELELIGDNWKNSIVMIDDFEVPGDTGYQFDNYGEGKRLNIDYIFPLLSNKWSVFFPAVSSSEESGFKRGCVVLVNKELEEKVGSISLLRHYQHKN